MDGSSMAPADIEHVGRQARGAGESDAYARAFRHSVPMRAVKEVIDRVAATDATVLVWGESGVGKEMITRAIHHGSPRRARPWVKVNCAALPANLLESELFGYERGAFTGAHRQKPGKFELAHTGTIFLDEIAEIPPVLQAKLLHVLQDHEFARIGSERDIRVDVRVIAATNKDLTKCVEAGTFREDLYYRLNVVNICVPPLRQRREEVPVLLEYFLEKYSTQYARPVRPVSPATLERFLDYQWPGNIRELENLVKRIVVLGREDWVASELVNPAPPPEPAEAAPTADTASGDERSLRAIAERAVREAESAALREALAQTHWHRIQAARRLKISYKTLLRKVREYGLESAS
jgi:two-component system, NtrC family, response regulator AtoC